MYKLCDSFAYQIHIDGLFNGDPHPGNILVSVDPVTREAKPVILDWGLVKEFDSKGQTAFSKLVRARCPLCISMSLRKPLGLYFCGGGFFVCMLQVYSVASMDVMGLMEAFEHMGFMFKEGKGAVVDPEIYMEALRVAFRVIPPHFKREEREREELSALVQRVSYLKVLIGVSVCGACISKGKSRRTRPRLFTRRRGKRSRLPSRLALLARRSKRVRI